MSLRKLPHLAVTLALLASCSPPTVATGAIAGSITSNNPDALKGATVRVLDKNNTEVASGKTTANGQYLLSGIPAGDVTVVVNTSQNSDQANITIYPGRVAQVPRMELTRASTNVAPQSITGKVVDVSGNGVANATITDLTGGTTNAQTVTNDKGEFTLSVTGLDKPHSLEVAKDNLITTTTVTAEKLTNVSVTLIPNARSVTGTVKDAVFSDNALSDVTVKVNGTSIATTTDKDGVFTLRGVPFDRVTLEASGREGYSASTLVQDQGRENVTGLTLNMTPYGNLVVHLQAESSPVSPAESVLDNVLKFGGSFHFFNKDGSIAPAAGNERALNPSDPNAYFDSGEWEYDNQLVWRNALQGTIQIKGTSISQNFDYAATEKREILSRAGTKMGDAYFANPIFTTTLRGVPGGRHDVSVSLTGHSIQKSISVVVQPLETVSTDLIILKRVDYNVTVGDVVGKILGIRPEDMANVRVGYVSKDETIDMSDSPDLRKAGVLTLKDVLAPSNPKRVVTPDANGRYRLFDVPTGTRLIVAGVSDGAGGFNSIYIPNTVSLLNVVAGQANQAPDLTLQLR
jgi:hypothetical protein